MRKGWEYKKLGEVCALTMGQSPDGNSINEVNGIEFHQGKTCFGERFLGISPLYSNAPTKLAEAHSVLLCVRAPVGYPNITDRKICIGRGLCALYAKREIDNSFLYYSLLGKQSYFEKNATGSTFKAISSKIVSNTTLSIPPLSTQLAIVSELDKINELIRLKKEQLKDFDNLAQSLFYEMFGDPVENEKGWEVKKLGEIAKSAIGLTYKPENVTEELSGTVVLRSSNIQNSILDFNDIVRVNVLVKEDKMVNDGDILMCSRNGSFRLVGKVALIKGLKERMSYGAFMTIIRSPYNPYLFEYFKTPAFRQYLITGKTTTVNQITVKMLNNLTLPLPPLSLQQLFAQRIEQIEREKSEVQKSIQDLETLLASRIQYWFE